jgi:hypothetical protein
MPQIQAQLTITLTDDGQLNINGPIHNRLLCYGMLEVARDFIAKQEAAPKPQIAIVGALPLKPQ